MLFQSCFFIFISYLKVGTINNPVTYFNIWWGFWFFLSLQGIFGLYEMSLYTFSIIFFGNFMLSLGILLIIKNNKSNTIIIENNLKWKYINIFQVMLMIVIAFFLFRTVITLSTTGLDSGDFRNIYIYGTNNIFGSQGIRFIFLNFIRGLILTFFIISIATFFLNKGNKGNKVALALSSLNIILYSGVMMGRMEIFRLVIIYVISILVIKSLSKSSSHLGVFKLKIKKRYLILVSILLISFTYLRDMNNTFIDSITRTIEQFFIYFTGPFIAFDQFVNEFSFSFETGWGRGFLGGIEVIFNGLSGLFIKSDGGSYATYLSRYTNERIMIGDDQSFNALYTMYFNFFADGKLIAVLICTFIIGIVIGLIYNYMTIKVSVYSLAVYLYLIHILIFGSIGWPLDGLSGWMVLINVLLIYIIVEKIHLKRNQKLEYGRNAN